MLLRRVNRVQMLDHEISYVPAVRLRATRRSGLDTAAVAASIHVYIEPLQESIADDSNFCETKLTSQWT